MIDEESLRRAKLRVKFKPFAHKVRMATGLSLKMPDSLFDEVEDKDIELMFKVIDGLGIKRDGNSGYWTAK